MIRIERHGAIGQRTAAIEFAGVNTQDAHQRHRVGVTWIEREPAIDGVREAFPVLLEELRERECLPRVLIERIELERPIDGVTRAQQRFWPGIEAEAVFVEIQVREYRPERRECRLTLDQPLEVIAQQP